MKIKLTAWAARLYDPTPSLWTLRRWVREGQIHPVPELVGKTYYVEETARRIGGDAAPERPSLLDRVKADQRRAA